MNLHAALSILVSPAPWLVLYVACRFLEPASARTVVQALRVYGIGFAIVALPLIATRSNVLHNFGPARAAGLVGACGAVVAIALARTRGFAAVGLETYRSSPTTDGARRSRPVVVTTITLLLAVVTAGVWVPPVATLVPAGARSDEGLAESVVRYYRHWDAAPFTAAAWFGSFRYFRGLSAAGELSSRGASATQGILTVLRRSPRGEGFAKLFGLLRPAENAAALAYVESVANAETETRSFRLKAWEKLGKPHACHGIYSGHMVIGVALDDPLLKPVLKGDDALSIVQIPAYGLDERTAEVLLAALPAESSELPFVYAGKLDQHSIVHQFVTQSCRTIWVARPFVIDGNGARAVDSVWSEMPRLLERIDLVVDLSTVDATDPSTLAHGWGRPGEPAPRSVTILFKRGEIRVHHPTSK